jgi:hypothetical protein
MGPPGGVIVRAIGAATRACGQRHFYGPLPVGSLQASKSDRLLASVARPDVHFRRPVFLSDPPPRLPPT